MNQIPSHLRGLSAVEIMHKIHQTNAPFGVEAYMMFMQMQLLIAVTHALSACTDAEFGHAAGAAEGRAIAFLNMICPDV